MIVNTKNKNIQTTVETEVKCFTLEVEKSECELI